MISYERYAEFRKLRGLKDVDVCRMTGIPQSTFSEWKKGNYCPKYDKMIKIATALELSYAEFMGVNMRVPELNIDPTPFQEMSRTAQQIPQLKGMQQLQKMAKEIRVKLPDLSTEELELIRLYRNSKEEAKPIILAALKSSQKDGEIPSLSSKEA